MPAIELEEVQMKEVSDDTLEAVVVGGIYTASCAYPTCPQGNY